MKQYQQLGIEEREKIQLGRWAKKSVRTIAEELGRSPSTISRELNRNFPLEHKVYAPRLAQTRASTTVMIRGKRPRLKNSFIRRYVIAKLKDDFSPEQISGRLTDEHPEYSISPEAIYLSLTPKFGQCGKIEKTAKIYATKKKIFVPGFKSKSSFGAHSRNRHNIANMLQV